MVFGIKLKGERENQPQRTNTRSPETTSAPSATTTNVKITKICLTQRTMENNSNGNSPTSGSSDYSATNGSSQSGGESNLLVGL